MLTSTLYRRSLILASQVKLGCQAAVFSTKASVPKDQKDKHSQ